MTNTTYDMLISEDNGRTWQQFGILSADNAIETIERARRGGFRMVAVDPTTRRSVYASHSEHLS